MELLILYPTDNSRAMAIHIYQLLIWFLKLNLEQK